jgi:Restriction endonuclease
LKSFYATSIGISVSTPFNLGARIRRMNRNKDALHRTLTLGGSLFFLLIVECKNWGRAVDRPVIQKLVQTRDAIAAHKAVVASPVGFSEEAVEVARANGVALWQISSKLNYIVSYCQRLFTSPYDNSIRLFNILQKDLFSFLGLSVDRGKYKDDFLQVTLVDDSTYEHSDDGIVSITVAHVGGRSHFAVEDISLEMTSQFRSEHFHSAIANSLEVVDWVQRAESMLVRIGCDSALSHNLAIAVVRGQHDIFINYKDDIHVHMDGLQLTFPIKIEKLGHHGSGSRTGDG